jgi:hypothetical protein
MVVRRLYDYSTTIRREKLRLLQKLLRLFQPERCDYCWPLLAIGRKPEKRCGGSRQWFRATSPALLLDCPAGWSVLGRPGARSQAAWLTLYRMQAGCTDPSPLAWSVLCCTAGHGSITGARPYIHYYNRAAVLVCTASGVAVVSGIGADAALDGMPSGVS